MHIMRKFSICFLFLMNAYISFSFRNAGIEAFRMILDNVLREEKQAETDATSKVCTYDRNVLFYFIHYFTSRTLTPMTSFLLIFII